MKEFLFPVEYTYHFDEEMIQNWKSTKLPYLSFAFNRFFPHKLEKELFWLYLYYTKSRTDDPYFKGKARFRFRVIDWDINQISRSDTYTYPSTLPDRVWFLVDKFEEVSRLNGDMLAYEDFRHPEGKNLGSCMRSSISPAICMAKIKVKQHYP